MINRYAGFKLTVKGSVLRNSFFILVLPGHGMINYTLYINVITLISEDIKLIS